MAINKDVGDARTPIFEVIKTAPDPITVSSWSNLINGAYTNLVTWVNISLFDTVWWYEVRETSPASALITLGPYKVLPGIRLTRLEHSSIAATKADLFARVRNGLAESDDSAEYALTYP